MEIKGKILAKKSDNKALKLSDGNWYNLNDPVIPYLAKANKGDYITLTFEKKGVSRYVSKLVVGKEEQKKGDTRKSSTGFSCKECGKDLKDDKYELCYSCNQKTSKPPKNTTKNQSFYGSPEDIAAYLRCFFPYLRYCLPSVRRRIVLSG